MGSWITFSKFYLRLFHAARDIEAKSSRLLQRVIDVFAIRVMKIVLDGFDIKIT